MSFAIAATLGPVLFQERGAAVLFLVAGVPGLVFLSLFLCGLLPEVSAREDASRPLVAVWDIAIGVLLALSWMAPYLLIPGLERPERSTLASGAGSGTIARSAIFLRAIGFCVVTPVVEEHFVRSYLVRAIDGWQTPVGSFSKASFAFTAVYFTLSHARWEWPVAAPAAIAFNLWIARRRSLPAVIVAHATANACIFAAASFSLVTRRGGLACFI